MKAKVTYNWLKKIYIEKTKKSNFQNFMLNFFIELSKLFVEKISEQELQLPLC